MAERPLRHLTSKPLLHVEEIDVILDRFRTDMETVADELAKATEVASVAERRVALPDLTEHAGEALRAWLQDETYALVEPEGPRGIEQHELHREILKKALQGLKRETLQRIAVSKKVAPDPRLEKLIEQVAGAFEWDEPSIARLVLDYTEDPRETEGGFSTRVFTLRDPADASYMAARLDYVNDRYYRTDIAKWFVFERYKRAGSTLRVWGSLQSYKAGVDSVDSGRLTTKQDEAACVLEVHDGSRTALVHDAKSHAAARSMLAAFKKATRADTLGYVPNVGSDADVAPRRLHPNTVFLLDVVTNRLQGNLFRRRNAILARFRLSRRVESSEEDSRKPALHAVRFDGDNLLDSPTACGLMWTEGRPLVDVTVSVLATDADTARQVPIRVVLEKDAVLVQTGLADSAVELAREVHRAVVREVERAIAEPVTSQRQAALERIIRNQAEHPDPTADAQLMTDSD